MTAPDTRDDAFAKGMRMFREAFVILFLGTIIWITFWGYVDLILDLNK